MKKYFIASLFFCLVSFVFITPVYAVEDPLAVANNKFGISILFDTELEQAAKLIDTSGGDWGYVTIPIQAGDKDLLKWQNFMDNAKRLHVIPIIRLATEGDYFNTQAWRRPNALDVLDFANFLNSLVWPTKNRYVIIFNEVNRGNEYGGVSDPQDYASLLSYAVTLFKAKSQNFFIISAGLDNAAPNQGTTYINEYDYMRGMEAGVPGIFNQIDGLASHSYPNPAFSQPPSSTSHMGIGSFYFERQLAQSMTSKTLPVFITETGWSTKGVTDDRIANYYEEAMSTIWSDPGIVAITPFLLNASGEPFSQFSFLADGGVKTKQYQMFESLPKVKGEPILVPPTPTITPTPIYSTRSRVLGVSTNVRPIRDFSKDKNTVVKKFSLSQIAEYTFKFLLNL